MKYTNTHIINKSLEETIRLMDNTENMKKWMPGLLRYEVIEGTPGQPGAKMNLYYKRGKGEMVMTETIINRNFPHEFDAIYEAKGVWNKQINRFIALDENTTEWQSHTEFKFSGFMKLVGLLLGTKGFQKQSAKMQANFKTFAESQ